MDITAADPRAGLPPSARDNIGLAGETPHRINYSRVTLKGLLAKAYNLKPGEISGPKWLDKERYNIVAPVPAGTDQKQLRLMLQRLLTDRFQIKFHRESRLLSVYRLKVGPKGPKLKPAEDWSTPEYKAARESSKAAEMAKQRETNLARAKESAEARAREVAAAKARGESPPPAVPAPTSSARGMHHPSATIAQFAEMLSDFVDRPIKDTTHLEGVFSFDLHWAESGTSTGEPSLWAALDEQLGLRLESGKELTEVLVIDQVSVDPADN